VDKTAEEDQARGQAEVPCSWGKVVSHFSTEIFNCNSPAALDTVIHDMEYMLKAAKFKRRFALETRTSMETLLNVLRAYSATKCGYQVPIPEFR
jgi:hypothetical protein